MRSPRPAKEILITKDGKPLCRLVPAEKPKPQMLGRYRDQIRIVGDIMSPAIPAEEWEAISNPDRVLNPDLPPLR